MSALHDLTLCEARDALRARKVSARELTQACLARIEAHADLNAFITHTPERALADADAADAALAAGEARALTGIPIGIKDLFCTKGVRTTAASRMLENFVPPYESTVTQKLFDAGALMPGKLNLDEFAMGSANETSYFGPVRSPLRDPARPNVPLTPGGSSGGSSAAVAAKLCYGATGTDTGGSIRQPAAFTGIVGMKPTYGRCSRYGIVAFASSLDQAGPMARTVRDAAALLSVMAGHDPKDSTSVDVAVPDFEAALTGDIRGLRVGLPTEYESDALNPFVRAARDRALAALRDAGAEPVEVSLPHTSYALPAYYVIAPAEASSNLARYDGVRYGLRVEEPGDDIHALYARTRAAGFGREVRRRILVGTYVLSAGYYDAYYAQALKVRTLIERDFTRAFEKVDVLLTPSAPSAAFALGEKHTDPTQMYLNDVFTVPVNLAGLPAISVPAGVDGAGLPLGVQLIGRPFDESTLFTAAGVIEAAHA